MNLIGLIDMTNSVDFYGPELKVERAEYHINELERIFRTFVRSNNDALIAKATKHKWRDRDITIGGEFPRHTPTVIGDGIHNLRAALDHAYCLLVEANGHTINRSTSFPFFSDKDSVEEAINGQINKGHGPSDRVRDAILKSIEPFPEGKGEPLYFLHKLDITDKHKVLIPTATKFTLHGFKLLLPNGNFVQLDDFGLTSQGPEVQKQGLMKLSGVRIEAEKNARATFVIGFQEGQPFEGENIVQTLRELLVHVRGTLEVLAQA